jgi:apolipoprotein N-acyltransferase
MDAASWTARQHLQHAELARHRAAENGRWFVVSSSSGLTQVIDPHGRRIAQLPLFDPGVLVAQVGKRSDLTFYTRLGWLIGPTCTVLSVLLLVASSVLSRRQAAKHRDSVRAN